MIDKGERMVKVFTKIAIILLMLSTLTSCNFLPHETEGRYLVKYINFDRNRDKNDEGYFYADNCNIYFYSFSGDEVEVCVQVNQEDGYMIEDYAVYEDEIYYIKQNGNMREIFCKNYKTGNEEVLLSNKDITPFNAGNELDELIILL